MTKFIPVEGPTFFDTMESDPNSKLTDMHHYVFTDKDGNRWTSFGAGYMRESDKSGKARIKENMKERFDLDMTEDETLYNSVSNKWIPTHSLPNHEFNSLMLGILDWYFRKED